MIRRLALYLAVIVWLGGCAAVDYVAPEGTTLTLSANPLSIATTGGQTTLTVIGTKDSGFQVPDGTTITFVTNLGNVTPQAETDGGIAIGYLTSTGQSGEATVVARSGNVASNEVTISIGESASTMTLTATPATLPSGGGTVQLLAVVFDENGSVASGVAVSFSTTSGTLLSGGSPVLTNSNGEARDTLTTSDDATVTATSGATSAEVTVPVATTEITELVLSADPTSLPGGGGTVRLLAVVFGSEGPEPGVSVAFKTTAGSLGNTGVVVTNELGEASNTLTTAQTAIVSATAGSVSDDITINIGAGDVYVTLTMARNSITNTSNLPGAQFCDPFPASNNPQIPIDLFAQVTDAAGNPIAGRTVTFFLDFAQISVCARSFGQFCPASNPQVTDVTDASGIARAQLGVSDADFALCNGFVTNPQTCKDENNNDVDIWCLTAVTAESGANAGATNTGLIEWGS